MKQVGILEAKTHLSALVDAASAGEEVLITRHGKPVAKLVTATRAPKPGPEAAERIRGLRDEIARKHGVDPDFDWKAAVEDGRP